MANYVLVYSGGDGMAADAAQQAAAVQMWVTWFTKLGAAVADSGNPFMPTVKHITAAGKVGDGPVGVAATGYSIIKADSLAAAVELAKGCPVLQGGAQISVYETFETM
jgi:hypothetical protein